MKKLSVEIFGIINYLVNKNSFMRYVSTKTLYSDYIETYNQTIDNVVLSDFKHRYYMHNWILIGEFNFNNQK